MMNTTIRLTISGTFAEYLQELKKDFPLMKYQEIIRLAVADFKKQQELKKRKVWEDSLPTLKLSDKQQDLLTKAIQAAENEDTKTMSIDEMWKEVEAMDKAATA